MTLLLNGRELETKLLTEKAALKTDFSVALCLRRASGRGVSGWSKDRDDRVRYGRQGEKARAAPGSRQAEGHSQGMVEVKAEASGLESVFLLLEVSG